LVRQIQQDFELKKHLSLNYFHFYELPKNPNLIKTIDNQVENQL